MGKTKEWHLNKSKAEISKWINSRGKQISPMGRLILTSENPTKLSNALQTYAKLEENETTLILYDDTLLGSGKDGFLITNKNVYTHKPFAEAHKIAIDDIKIVCGNTEVFFYKLNICSGLSFIDSSYKTELIQFLNSILAKDNKQSDNENDEDENEDFDEEDDEDEDNDEIDDIDNDEEDDDESEFEESEDDDSEDEEVVDDDDEYEEDDEKIEVSSKSLKVKRTTRNKTFEGILYDDYKIGRGMLFDEAIEILKDDGWIVKDFDEIENTMVAVCPKEDKLIYGFPVSTIILTKQNIEEERKAYNNGFYGELLSSVCLIIHNNFKKQFDSFLQKQVFEKYSFLKKFNENLGVDINAPKEDLTNKSFLEKLDWHFDYSRAIIVDSFGRDSFGCFSFLTSSFGNDSLYKILKKDWEEFLLTDIDDDATVIFGERNQDYRKQDFFRLLKKWNDVISRKDETIKISLPNDEQNFEGKKAQLQLEYKDSLRLYAYKRYNVPNEEFKLELSYEKDSREIQSFVTMHFGNSDESKFSKETKLCLQNLLLHLDEYDDDEEFSGEEMWDNLSEIITTELAKIEEINEKAKKRREEDYKKFQDDFDNL